MEIEMRSSMVLRRYLQERMAKHTQSGYMVPPSVQGVCNILITNSQLFRVNSIHAPLETIRDCSLTRLGTLRKKASTTKWPGGHVVTNPDKTNIIKPSNLAFTNHAVWYLNLDRKVGISRQRQAYVAVSGYILDDLRCLESLWVCCSGGGVYSSGKWAGAVLVNLNVSASACD